MVFLEDYDMKVARELVQGVDLWLNNPRRGEEACGTSGMKAGINGVLNLSILDGWWDEAAEFTGGWTIGDREPYSEDQDALHASAIYYLLENEIVPHVLSKIASIRRGSGSSASRNRCAISVISSMPAAWSANTCRSFIIRPTRCYSRLRAGNFQEVRDRVRWNAQVRQVWDQVRFVETGAAPVGTITSGRPVPVRAAVELAGLKPEDVRVEVVLGRVGIDGGLEDTEVQVLPPTEQIGTVAVFAKDIVPERTGRLGYALRISPDHYEDPLTRPCTNLLKWGTTL